MAQALEYEWAKYSQIRYLVAAVQYETHLLGIASHLRNLEKSWRTTTAGQGLFIFPVYMLSSLCVFPASRHLRDPHELRMSRENAKMAVIKPGIDFARVPHVHAPWFVRYQAKPYSTLI